MYVDDMINAGDQSFQLHAMSTLKVFESKPRVYDQFDFFGAQIRTLHDGMMSMSQRYYARTLRVVDKKATFEEFRRARALFSWLTNSRPDISCVANRAAQVTERTFCTDKIRELNRGIKKVLDTVDVGLKYGRLDFDSLHLRVYADASFATNDDLSSQIGFIVLLCDDSNRCHVLDYSSRKSRRVVRSIMGGEVHSFMDAFDTAFITRNDLETILGVRIKIVMLTDSKQLFDAVTCGRRTAERRLGIDVAAARQSYRAYEIGSIGFVRGSVNPADGLTKVDSNGALMRIIETGMDTTPVQQWIHREEMQDDVQGEMQSTGNVLIGGSVKGTDDESHDGANAEVGRTVDTSKDGGDTPSV